MTKKQKILTIIFGVIFSLGMYDFLKHFNVKKEEEVAQSEYKYNKDSLLKAQEKAQKKDTPMDEKQLMAELTDESVIINYVKKYHELPGYYLTKSEARKLGWNPSDANLCEALPGKAIGGDRFGNREGKLPKDKVYYEADVNYRCGKRNADRIVFTKQGEVWLTKDHYKTFEKK